MDKYSAAYVDLSNVRELVEWEGKVCSGRSGHDWNSSDGSGGACLSSAKINFVDLDKLWNFIVGNILIWNHLVMQKRRLNLKILKFEFFKRPRMEKLPKWKL